MKRFYFTIIILINFNLEGISQTQTVDLQPSYANQSFFSLENGEVSNIANTDWDLAFSTFTMSSSIRINGGMGTELYSYPLGDTTDWNTFNSTNISNWQPIHNSDTNWFIGAFDKNSTSMFDMGWGIYNMVTHFVTGDSLYAIKTVNGNWKKLWIEKLAGGEYSFKYADLDGSNQVNAVIDQSAFSGKNFAYYSLDQNTSLDREPLTQDWDITFSKYITPVQGMAYGVTGVLMNDGIKACLVENLPDPNSYTNYSQHVLHSEMNTIGYDWKTFDMSSFSYVLDPYRCYFLKDYNDKIWRIIFTSFEGSSTGIVEFNTEEVSSSTSNEFFNSSFSSFELYPNPSSNHDVTVIYDTESKNIEISIIDINGKLVFNHTSLNSGFSAKTISTSNLDKGIYIVRINSNGDYLQKKLIIN